MLALRMHVCSKSVLSWQPIISPVYNYPQRTIKESKANGPATIIKLSELVQQLQVSNYKHFLYIFKFVINDHYWKIINTCP